MIDRYIVKDGKKMRYGYTTGSCAAAASKAAAMMALTKEKMDFIRIDTPKGWKLDIEVKDYYIGDHCASCSVEKDGGDDPDNTHGILVTSTVEIIDEPKIEIKGGRGVGVVTKPGLSITPGSPAINPVPQSMIKKEVSEVLPKNKGAVITISVPKGEEVAKRTFNPKLGIMGGISILGTSGIVVPMSEEAFKESLALEVKMAVQEGIEKLILVPGNYGRDLAVSHYGFDKEHIMKTSNFVGFMLEQCVANGIKEVLMIGHIGKFVKLSGGIFHTHSKVADGRIEIIASNMALLGAPTKIIEELFKCVTTEAAIEVIEKNGYEKVFEVLCQKAEKRCKSRVYDELEVGIVMFSMDQKILGVGEIAKKLLEEFKNA
ncbi:cobalt-precorrin-5B (C(1))-methyltransferase CbiD [Crassaminicella profunda]|uniref:cobalt-precorrin-5B (C(1))-methyltransferase CbiD n=1 Tax=Crassaminicella profunda TaxID=1286698 RepID=UPI001CA72831|nr:cobalt-precorrin-5B (C(1))-methyltransferase CbiD [Crassaminicella profunda]QZY57367.1 cobalt-precorrin-5B (C(1))-methyltransferase CbiD [Crassaminicella profunda]